MTEFTFLADYPFKMNIYVIYNNGRNIPDYSSFIQFQNLAYIEA